MHSSSLISLSHFLWIQFGVERMLDVEDITDAAKPDEKIVMTYVSFFFKGFATYHKEQANANSIKNAIIITQRHHGWINEYHDKVRSLLEWIAEKVKQYSALEEGAEGHGNTTDAIRGTLQKFYEYREKEKPEKRAAIASLASILGELIA